VKFRIQLEKCRLVTRASGDDCAALSRMRPLTTPIGVRATGGDAVGDAIPHWPE
jgi:hypothetical protein